MIGMERGKKTREWKMNKVVKVVRRKRCLMWKTQWKVVLSNRKSRNRGECLPSGNYKRIKVSKKNQTCGAICVMVCGYFGDCRLLWIAATFFAVLYLCKLACTYYITMIEHSSCAALLIFNNKSYAL